MSWATRLAWAALAALPVVACGCGPSLRVREPSRAAMFDDTDRVVFAFELERTCKLERADDSVKVPEIAWYDLDTTTLANRTFTIQARETLLLAQGNREVVSEALKLEDKHGDSFWVRSRPEHEVEKAIRNFECAFPRSKVGELMPKLTAPIVRLAPASARCHTIEPIFGDVDGVTFGPYTVTARSLFVHKGKPIVGLRLEADGGEKVITVPASTLDACFVPADRVPPPPDEASQLTGWLATAAGGVTAPPRVSIDTIEQLTALELDRCMREGTKSLVHYECRMPILRIEPSKEPGRYGPSVIRIVRERVVDAVHLYAGHLVPAADIVSANVAVRLGKIATSSFGRSFNDELDRSLADGDLRLKRASNGFRLLRTADVLAGVPVTHHVDIELSYVVPEVESGVEHRIHDYVAGSKQIDNPAYDEANTAVERAREHLASAQRAAAVLEAGTKVASEMAGSACAKGGSQLGGATLGFLAGALCKSGASSAGAAAEKETLRKAEAELQEAREKLKSTSRTVAADDKRSFSYDATVYRRSGDAIAKITIVASGQSAAQSTSSVQFHFEAKDDEYPASPEHKLNAKVARVPNANDVERQLAENVLRRVDEAIIRWGAQRQIGGDIGELQPGTRSWMVAVARHAASDRNVKLLSDLLERRQDILGKDSVRYPVTMPNQLSGRCFTFAAIPLDPSADVNLSLGRMESGRFRVVSLDHRATSDAAFETCDLTPGEYAVRLSHGAAKSLKGVLVSMFESTPGAMTAEQTIASSRGIPTTARKGEQLVLNGEGIVEFRGTNNRVVTGRTGDRDGDGIPDDEDRCPYDPETMNGYLDEDGCPDVAPPSTASGRATAGGGR